RHGDLHHIMGMFVNSLALRNYPHNGKTCLEFLKEVKESSIQAFENQDVQFEYLVEQLNPPRDPSRNPIFDVLLVVQNFEPSKREMKASAFTPYLLENKTSKFDFTLFVNEIEDEIFFDIEYCTALFKEATIQRMAVHFLNVLRQMVSEPGIKIGEMEILTPKEKQQLLIDFNETAADYPGERTIHQLFEEQVRRRADNIAIVGPLQMGYRTYRTYMTYITYRELNRKSNQLAHFLKEKGIPPDTIVGIMMERCLKMIIGILGILKAGGAYLPIDPDYPIERKQYMLADSGAKVLVTAGLLAEEGEKVRRWEGEKIFLEPGCCPGRGEVSSPVSRQDVLLTSSFVPTVSTLTSTCRLSSTNLAYIIYTSGSTGKPRGVMVEQASAVNVLSALHNEYPFMGSDVYLLKTSAVFDVSVTELFGWFLGGGRLAILETGGEKDPTRILHAIETQRITHVNFVPSMFNAFLEGLNQRNIGKLLSLRYIFLAGEALLPGLVDKFRRLNINAALENIYGPTEGTVYSGKYPLYKWEGCGNIPIGKPLPNVRLYILNKYDHLQPMGVSGELCISGVGVARGYLNNPEMTNYKFLINVFGEGEAHELHEQNNQKFLRGSRGRFLQKEPPGRRRQKIYKTGDLGRWLPEGNIEFLGRIDYQVKIRGFRVEPGEIENQILNHQDVKEAVVVSRERENKKGDQYFCAYIVATSPGVFEKKPGITVLKRYLSKKLPDYMIPSYFIGLDKIPLTGSGKVDRKALPEPGVKAVDNYAAPQNEIEEKLVKLWSEILDAGRLRIGIDDNFFQLGGHSLNAVILVSRIHKEFAVTISLGEIFKTPTIRRLAGCIRGRERGSYASIEPAEEREYYPLSSAQKRLFFLDKFEDIGTAYNMPAVFRIEGETDNVRFENTFNALIARHEPLRTSFHLPGNEAVQRVHDETVIGHWSLVTAEADRREIDRIIKDFIKPFDLSQAPLMRAGLWKLGEQEHLFLFDIHHIISDGTSTGILVDDFIRWYDEEK
ncbi:MAG: amino acid adenylation domain-containing protein, partial [Candidatus Aminicenantes bacterium]